MRKTVRLVGREEKASKRGGGELPFSSAGMMQLSRETRSKGSNAIREGLPEEDVHQNSSYKQRQNNVPALKENDRRGGGKRNYVIKGVLRYIKMPASGRGSRTGEEKWRLR